MTITKHRDQPVGQRHGVHQWEFPTSTERDAHTYANSDVGKEVKLTDGTFWRIISVSSGVATFREVAKDISSLESMLANTSGTNTGDQDLSGKQDVLVSGTNIKTINGQSLLGSGDLIVAGTTPSAPIETTVPIELTVSASISKVTPTDYGMAFIFPDATTFADAATNVYIMENAGGYPIRVLNNVGQLLGFIPAKTTSVASLMDISTPAGIWSCSNLEFFGISARLLGTAVSVIYTVINLGDGKELILFDKKAMIYDKYNNIFGSIVTITTNTVINEGIDGVLLPSGKILIAWIETATKNILRAEVLSITGITITIESGGYSSYTAASNFSNPTTFGEFIMQAKVSIIC